MQSSFIFRNSVIRECRKWIKMGKMQGIVVHTYNSNTQMAGGRGLSVKSQHKYIVRLHLKNKTKMWERMVTERSFWKGL
jgi:hypothetical protein